MKRPFLVITFLAVAVFGAGLAYTRDTSPTSNRLGAQGIANVPSPLATDLLYVVSGGVSGRSAVNQVLTPSRLNCVTSADCTTTSLGSQTLTLSAPLTATGLITANVGVKPAGASGGYAPDIEPSTAPSPGILMHVIPFTGTSATGGGSANTFPNAFAFTGTTTYWCSVDPTSGSASLSVAHTSTTQITIVSSSGSPAVDVVCMGW